MPETPTKNTEPASATAKREPHARLPDSVLYHPTITTDAKIVYAALARHAFQAGLVYVGQRRLAELLHLSQKTVSRRIAELIDAKLIELSTPNQTTEPGKRAGYRLLSSAFRQKSPHVTSVGKFRKPRITEPDRAKAWANSRTSIDDILGDHHEGPKPK